MHKNNRWMPSAGSVARAIGGAAFWIAVAPAIAQDMGKPATGTPGTGTPASGSAASGTVAPEPNPYYVGVGQGFTHDSNVYRIPSGPSDTYSSTTVFGGFDQPISRQRVYGRAGVSLNRYFNEHPLDNTSYDFLLGGDLATIENISGNVNLGLTQNLAAPVSGVNLPTAVSNIESTQRANALLRWGGPSLLTLEGGLGYSAIDYSAPQYVTSESNETTASITLFYRPGPIVRVGLGGRFERTHTPKAVVDPVNGGFRSNDTDGNNLDLLLDYTPDAQLTTNARLSYTQQTNSLLKASNFSGWTGSLVVGWQPTAKTGVHFDISRDVGFEVSSVNQYAVVQSGTGLTLTPVAVSYQNNRVTDTTGLSVTYAATAKVAASGLLRYTRQRLVADVEITGIQRDVDVAKSASLALNYAITRAWSASCSVAYETRDVASLVSYSYSANVFNCATQFTWK